MIKIYKLFIIKKIKQELLITKIQAYDVKNKIVGIRDDNRILEIFLTAYNFNIRKKENRIHFIKDMKSNIMIEDDIYFTS